MTPQVRAWLTIAWVGMIVAGLGLLLYPTFRYGQSLKREIAQKRDELAGAADGPEIISRLSRELENLKTFGEGRMTPIPEQSDVASLMRTLSTTLDDLGLNRREITTGEPERLDDASAMPMSVMVEGRFTPIFEAVREIESLPRLVRVKRLKIQQESGSRKQVNREGFVRADLMLDVFFDPADLHAKAKGGER